MSDNKSARTDGLLSDDRVRDWLRGELHRFVNVKRTMTRAGLSDAAQVNIHTIDAILSNDPGKWRPIHPGVMLSLCVVMGSHAVGGMLALIGYGGAQPLDECDAPCVRTVVADTLSQLSVIANAASDGRIDHTERPACQEAADMIIMHVTPLSSAGGAE